MLDFDETEIGVTWSRAKLVEECTIASNRIDTHLDAYINLMNELESKIDKTDDADTARFELEYKEFIDLEIRCDQFLADLKSRITVHRKRMESDVTASSLRAKDDYEQERLDLERERLRLEQSRLDLERSRLDGAHARPHTATVKLPKLELMKFYGDLLKWPEFWDSFESSIHDNPSLFPVDKMNYLKARLEGPPLAYIAGLHLSNHNYDNVVDLLKGRYGNKEFLVSALYNELLDMPVSDMSTCSLRNTYDTIEKHMRNLETLRQDVSSPVLLSIVFGKLPKEVVTKLREVHGDREWTVNLLRLGLKNYITTLEFAENTTRHTSSASAGASTSKSSFTTETLFVKEKQNYPQRPISCIYCDGSHYNDQCTTYRTVTERKKKIRGHCYSCLKSDHSINDCRSKKKCIYCDKYGYHHRSLCIQKFPVGKVPDKRSQNKKSYKKHENKESDASAGNTASRNTTENNTEKSETSMLAQGEQVMMQTAQVKAGTVHHFPQHAVDVKVILDSGSQRTCTLLVLGRLN